MDKSRLDREAEFHNQAFSEQTRRSAGKFYAIASRTKQHYHGLVERYGAGRRALGIGVGVGGHAFELASLGASVVGIDISDVGVDQAQRKAAEEGMSDRLDFRVMNAESLDFPDGSFDLVYGSGILHHLDLDKVCGELSRVMTDGGTGVFFEPLGHNPLINLYRRLTPQMRTADEHPLRIEDLEVISRFFAGTVVEYFHLTSLGSVMFSKIPGYRMLRRSLELVDTALFKIPWIRRYAWIVVIRVENTR